MDRWLGLSLMVALTMGSTGCMQHTLRGGDCSSGSCGGAMTSECGDCGMMDCGSCNSCGDGQCGSCETPSSGILTKARCAMTSRPRCATCGNGILGRLGGLAGVQCKGNCGGACGGCGVAGCGGRCGVPGCGVGTLGWQQGGIDYSSHLQPGLLGHNAGAQLNSRPFNAGPPSAQVAYPYYTVRGPRDFLMTNPPSIGR